MSSFRSVVRSGRIATNSSVVDEMQLRWLVKGLNLRAWVLASWAEEIEDGAPTERIPAWLCWLAVHMSDEGAAALSLSPEDYVNDLLSASWINGPRARFLIGWLSVGLLGENFAKAIAFAKVLPKWIGDQMALPAEATSDFLLARVIEPARNGQRPLSTVVTSKSDLEARFRAALNDARGRRQLSERQFKNVRVKRFWISLSGPGGPMADLLEKVEHGTLEELPTAEALAADVDGEGDVIGNYRNAIDHRLEEFLRALRVAVGVDAELNSLDHPAATRVTPEELRLAVNVLREAIPRLERERCPSVEAYRRLQSRLSKLATGEGDR